MPDEIKYEQDATPPQYTDNGESVIEAGTSLRVKLLGIRTDVASMWAVATIREDYLGFVAFELLQVKPKTDFGKLSRAMN